MDAFFETLAVRRSRRSSDTRRRCCGRGAAGRVGQRRGDRRRRRDAADQTLAVARSHRLSERRVRRATRHVGVRGVRHVVFRHLLRDVSRYGQIRHVRSHHLLLDAALRTAVHGNNPDVALHHEAGQYRAVILCRSHVKSFKTYFMVQFIYYNIVLGICAFISDLQFFSSWVTAVTYLPINRYSFYSLKYLFTN